MNRPPSILVDTGFEVDQNGVLTELVFPEVVTTSKMPTKVIFLGQNFNWNPSNASTLLEFGAPNMVEVTTSLLKNYTSLTTARFRSLSTITVSNLGSNAGMLYGCSALTTVDMPSLQSVYLAGGSFVTVFGYCTSLTEVTLPELTSITHSQSGTYGGTFMGCSGLVTVNLPKIQTITDTSDSNKSYGDTFFGCHSLQSVTLGSEGNPVSSIKRYPFYGLSQTNLTITIYTTNGASLAGEPWGATGAAIKYVEA